MSIAGTSPIRVFVNGVDLAARQVAFGAEPMGDSLAPIPYVDVITENRIRQILGDSVSCELVLPDSSRHPFEATVWLAPGPTDPLGDSDDRYRFAGLPQFQSEPVDIA